MRLATVTFLTLLLLPSLAYSQTTPCSITPHHDALDYELKLRAFGECLDDKHKEINYQIYLLANKIREEALERERTFYNEILILQNRIEVLENQ